MDETITFSLGCFWSPDAQFGCVMGVTRTRVGYTSINNESFSADRIECIQIDYNTSVVTFKNLLDRFWKWHDPTVQQLNPSYISAIYYHNCIQNHEAKESLVEQQKEFLLKPILTKILPIINFDLAEDYHQKHYLKRHITLFPGNISTHVATRLNGYLAGYGTREQFEDEKERMGLNRKQINFIRKQLEN
ncbi:unnamed protein product [Didymodactylos carnosus]|uniref:peptide-methionine (S)-S-oxide reductase n=1 Tax=Didymodactylos carnosus TaxID=1234261 RepID=A0A815YXG4_9BILA|nr:unnamed protein product [Didymodactylos carnosus]CAF1576124.1 unnamed protein product [Didymodactylos carnosus]CAF3802072.1 unnamed protein product [Didymodactylos carnosus]CAF4441137.1 unnamed protein product [Didymodactylos carnosus]